MLDHTPGSKALSQKRITGWRLWLFCIVAVTVIAAVLFVLVELSLRMVGYGYPAAAIIRHEANRNVSYCDNVKFGWRFFPRNIAREFEPFILPADKPHNTCRIFILGASAAMGTTGEELFREHVHLNFAGNYLVAKTILEQMRQILPEKIRSRRATNRPLLTEAECAERLAYTDWDRYRIADKDSGDRRLHYKYGRLLAEDLKDYHAAAKEYRLVQRLLPYCHLGYDVLGSVLRGLGDLDAAVVQCPKAIQIRPTSADPHYYVGWVCQKQGNTDKAVRYYSKTIQLQPNYVPAYNNLAEILNQQGKVNEAVKICRRGLHFAPNGAILHGNLGILLNKLGYRDKSLKELKIALELDPNSTNIRKILQAILRNRTD